MKRGASDKARLAAGKRSIGPATLQELLASLRSFSGAYCSLQRDCALVVVGVAGNESAVLFPRKDALELFFGNGTKIDTKPLPQQLVVGVAELVQRPGASKEDTASMAAGYSKALCCINRFLVANKGGVAALTPDGGSLFRQDDDGVVSLMGGGSKQGRKRRSATTTAAGAWSPRILLIQASADRSRDYNAFMNCAFASMKLGVVLDGCYIPSGMSKDDKNSAFLEQTCDRTGGIYLAPSGAAQVGPALTEVLLSVFLPPPEARHQLHLPGINKVDFRARAFDTGETVDMAYVCNQCLSIFQKKPKHNCPTCGADIKPPKNGEKTNE